MTLPPAHDPAAPGVPADRLRDIEALTDAALSRLDEQSLLNALLERFSALAPDQPRLIFLGDLICRGPSSLAALALWAAPSLDARFAQVHRLAGNHEQLLMLSIGDAVAQAAYAKWMTMDGMTFVDELRRKTGRFTALAAAGVGLASAVAAYVVAPALAAGAGLASSALTLAALSDAARCGAAALCGAGAR